MPIGNRIAHRNVCTLICGQKRLVPRTWMYMIASMGTPVSMCVTLWCPWAAAGVSAVSAAPTQRNGRERERERQSGC